MPDEYRRGEYVISTDPAKIDLDVVCGFLARSYWAEGISREVVERSIAGSLNFGLYLGAVQIGFARVVTDYATFGYVADVFVLEEHRGRKLAVWLMETIRSHPRLQGFRRWMLGTRDAHTLYEKVGFRELAHPERMMEIVDPAVYATDAPGDTSG